MSTQAQVNTALPTTVKPVTKYGNIWEVLKSGNVVRLIIYSESDRSKVIRGISQIKNLDTAWKRASYSNTCKRLTLSEVEKRPDGGIVLEVSLKEGAKYRNGVI